MQVSIEESEGLQRRLTVELPAAGYEAAVKNKLQAIARGAKIKGFRPGKVPMRVVESRYGTQARAEVFDEVVQSSLYEALTREKLHPAGRPEIERLPEEPGGGLRYAATFEIYPEFEPAPPEGLEIDKVVVDITDDDVSTVIDTIRQQRLEWKDVERSAAEGDRVIIDYKGTIDGEAFAGGEGTQVPVELGAGRMVEGFETQLLGASAGDDRTVEITFPDDYPHEDVAGKLARFEVKVSAVQESELPEVDEEFIKAFGVDDGKEESFRTEVRANMQRELDNTLSEQLKQRVMDALLEQNAFDVPNALIEQESEQLAQKMRADLAAQGVAEHKGATLDASMFEAEAKRRVALGLVVGEIVKRNEFKADPAKVRATVENIAAGYEQPEEVISWYYHNPQRLSEIEFYLLEQEVVSWVVDNANVNEQKRSFSEVMNRSEAAAG